MTRGKDIDWETPFTDDDHAKVIGFEAEMMALELALGEGTKAADDKIIESFLSGWIYRGKQEKRDPPTEFATTGGFATALILANTLRTTAVILRRVHPDHLHELLEVFADVPGEKQDAVHKIWSSLIKSEQLSRTPKNLS